CISEWGHDFRPAYRRLRGLKQELGGVPILGLTATATRRVAGDIIRQLGMVKPDGFKGSFFRPNLMVTAHKKGDGRGSRKDLLASWADVLGHRRVQEGTEDADLRREAQGKSVAMYELAEAPGCRHQRLVAHFDEPIPACGTACDFCRGTTFTDLVRPVRPAPA